MARAERHPTSLTRAKLNDRRIGLHISALGEIACTLIPDRDLDPMVLVELLMMLLRLCRAVSCGYSPDQVFEAARLR